MIIFLNLTHEDRSYRREPFDTSKIYYVDITKWQELYYYETLNDNDNYESYFTAKFKMNQNSEWLTFEEFYKKHSKKIESPKFNHIGMEIVNDNYEIEFHNINTNL